MKSEIVFLGTMMPLHTSKKNLSMDGEGAHEVPALTGELLEIDD